MPTNAKLLRWLAPFCLLILLVILILAMNFTSLQTPGTPASTPTQDLPALATAIHQVDQTATVQAQPTATAQARQTATAQACLATKTAPGRLHC